VAKLGDLERRVMDLLWETRDDEVTARHVADAMPEYAYTTVATILDRLARKGVVRNRIDGRVKRYQAIGSSGAHTAVLMHDALAAEAAPEAALRRFAENLTEAEAAVLRAALDPPHAHG
jgi:predicted transcriptional regulator